jgi:catechol 2,3-dioxygenase-like lactoylglutathione lyase family enzyme
MLKVDHIVFPVWNAKASLAFYRDIMGFSLVSTYSGDDWGGRPWLMMFFSPGDGREIVLVALRGTKRPKYDGLARDVRHLAFAEKSVAALQGWRRKLRTHAIEFWEETHGPQRSIYFEDPNGAILEITAPPTRASGKTRKAALAHAEKWIAS